MTGKLLSQFIHDVGRAALVSAIAGGVIGYLVGWYSVRKNGLGWTATAYDVDAAVNAKKQNAPRSDR